MTRYVQRPNGQMAGSIGAGRDAVPSPAVQSVPVHRPADEGPFLAGLAQQFTPTLTVAGTNGAVYAITPGIIDDNAVAVFSSGQCHALAQAVHEATGWPMVALFDQDCCYDADVDHADIRALGVCACQFNHVVVQVPDGRYLDITGLRTAEELDDEVSWCEQLYIVDDGTVTAFLALEVEAGVMRAPHMDAARSMVEPLLRVNRLR